MKYYCILYEKEKKGSRSPQIPAVQLIAELQAAELIATTGGIGTVLALLPNLCGAVLFLIPIHHSEEKLDFFFFHRRDHNRLQRLKSLPQCCLIHALLSVARRGGENHWSVKYLSLSSHKARY